MGSRTGSLSTSEGRKQVSLAMLFWAYLAANTYADLSRTSDYVLEELNRLVPSFEQLIPNAKIHLLQSIVSKILVETVFDAYFVGLSVEQSEGFAQMEQFLASFASSA